MATKTQIEALSSCRNTAIHESICRAYTSMKRHPDDEVLRAASKGEAEVMHDLSDALVKVYPNMPAPILIPSDQKKLEEMIEASWK